MDADLELAINALDEIDDISEWELELTNLLTEFTLQVQFHMDTLNAQLFKAENLQLLKEDQTPIQKICIKKLKEYRCTILDQYQALHVKDLEKARLEDEIRQIKEANMACHAKLEDLRSYLDEADATNSMLQSENASLRYKLIALEESISNMENKNEQLTKEVADEESKKYEAFIDHFQTNISNQNELIRKLQQELEGYGFLKKKYDHLEKENTHQKKEVMKLEETITELNKDYQSLVVEFTKASYQEKNTTPKAERCKAPVTSRNLDDCEAEFENKNTIRNGEIGRVPSIIIKKFSPHMKTHSLMHEVILSKAPTPTSSKGSVGNFEEKMEQAMKHRFTKNSGDSRQKNFLSESFKPSTLNYIKDQEELYKNGGSQSVNQLDKKEDFQVKSKGEVTTSGFNSETDVDMERDRKQPVCSQLILEQMAEKDDIFERENILLSWDENDFPRLTSRLSLRSERSGHKMMDEFPIRKIPGSPQHVATRVFDEEENKAHKNIGDTCANLEMLSRKLEGLVTNENLQNALTGEGDNNNLEEDLYTFRTPIKMEAEENKEEEQSEIRPKLFINTGGAKTFEKTTQTETEPLEMRSAFARNRGSSAEKMCLSEIDQPTTASQATSTCELKREVKRKYNFSEYHLMQSSLLSASTAFTNKPLNTFQDTIYSRTIVDEDNNEKVKKTLLSVAEKVGPMIASASLTYLLLRTKVIS